MRRIAKLSLSIILCLWVTGSFMVTVGGQTETVINNWIAESINSMSYKVRDVASEYSDPYFVPHVLLGPIVTRILPQAEFHKSQLSELLRDSIYLKLSAGLARTSMEVVDIDLLSKTVASSGLTSPARLNAMDIASSYTQDSALRLCLDRLLDAADMVVLGQITLNGNQALTIYTILTREDGQLYLDRTPLSVRNLSPDISMTIQEDSIQKMMEFVVSTDDSIQSSVTEFIQEFTDIWATGEISMLMELYDSKASAIAMTVNERHSVRLTNVLDRNALELAMLEFQERYKTTNFDLSNPEIYNVKRNSKNVVSLSIDFNADVTAADGKARRIPLLSLYMQLRRKGRGSWRIYFQRIKEVPKYSIQLWGNN